VAAWVYLDHTTLNAMSRIAVSQSANIKSGFQLLYNFFGHQWQFSVTRGPTDDYAPVTSDSSFSAGGAPALTTWTHLVGVFDADAHTVTLYVNGVAQPSTSHTIVFDATGPLQVGRVKEFGSFLDGSEGLLGLGAWSGRVDDVRAYRRALTPAEITAVYNGGDTGTALGMPGALQGAQQGQTGATAMAFSSSARSSYDPDPYTDPTTYSLECWFRTEGTPGGQTLISFSDQPDGDAAQHDRRIFLDASGHVVASTGPGVANTARSGSSYADGAWHHVAVTVSPANGILLYLDGTLSATAAYTAPGNVTGYWRWGGDAVDGVWPAGYFTLGELDEVAVYAGELTAARIAVHYHANH
jgi:Concanavalin A-like lectin/glucanases superfamily